MPKFLVSTRLVEEAAKCLAVISFFYSSVSYPSTLSFFLYSWKNQFFILLALRIVSAVVNVFELTITNVSSQFRPSVALPRSYGSTLAKNLSFLPSAAFSHFSYYLIASWTNSMLRYDPPIPITTTFFSD